MQSLFPQPHAGSAPQPLLQFKAGKCNMAPQGRTFLVTPDLQKGMITLTRTNDSLVNFQWSDRGSNAVDTGLILFPDDVDFKKVNTGRNDDRVYMLKWRTGGKVLMFWMQDKSSAKDADNCSKVNEFINNPRASIDTGNLNPSAGEGAAGPEAWMQMLGLGNPPGAAARRPEASVASAVPAPQSSLLGNLDLSSLLQGGPAASQPRTVTRPAASAAPTGAALTSEQLARTLAAMTAAQQPPRVQHPALQDVLGADAVIGSGLLDDAQALEALTQTLPEGQQTPAHVLRTLRSPQLRQAMGALSEGISGEAYNTVLANLGVSPGPGTDQLLQGNAVGAFMAAVQAAEDAATATTATPPTEGASAGTTSAPQDPTDETKDAPMEEG